MTHAGRLEGKRVLITGTAGGQGAAAQVLFASHGARVAGCDNRAGAAEATAEQLAEEGFDVTGATVDLTDPVAAADWVDESATRMGGIDVLYNNAAGMGVAPFAETSLELWKHVLNVELNLVFHVTSPAWTHLRRSGGSIVNVASVSALRGVAPSGRPPIPQPRARSLD